MNRLRGYLIDLTQEIERIERFTADGQDAFSANEVTQYALMRCYEIIGEIVKRLPDELLEKHREVEWTNIVRFRDFLIHQYDKVVISRIWEAVTKLPALKAAVEAMKRDAEADNPASES